MYLLKKRNYSSILLKLLIVVSICNVAKSLAVEVPPIKITLEGYTYKLLAELENVRGASRYEVRYSVDSTMRTAMTKEVVMTKLELADLKPETIYYVQARVLHDGQWSDWSNIQHCKTAAFSTTIGTYNILSSQYDPVFPNNIWEERKRAMKATILHPDNYPDIFGIQEGMVKTQVLELAELLGEHYVSHISSRNISPRAIFWKPEKYSLVEFDDIEVLDDDVKGHSSQRYVTYVRLKKRHTDKDLLIVNLHAPSDYRVNKAAVRNELTTTVARKAIELSENADTLPVIVLGDFNELSQSSDNTAITTPMIMAENDFVDTFHVSSNLVNAYYGTHDRITTGEATSGRNMANCSKRIDYIFGYPKNRLAVSDYRIIIDFEDDSYTVLKKPISSDHRPVRSTIHFYY